MDKTRNGCLTTEQAVHPGSSPRTPERCRVRRGVPACVSYRDRVHDRRDDLDGRIAEDERPAAAGTDRKLPSAKINLSSRHSVEERTRVIPGVPKSTGKLS